MNGLDEPTVEFSVPSLLARTGPSVGAAALRAFVDHTPGLALVRDTRGRCVVANQTYRRMVATGQDGAGMEIPGPELQRVHQRIDRDAAHVLRTNAPIRGWLTYETPQGTRHLSTIVFPIPGPDGEGYVGVLGSDLTELVELRRTVTDSEDRSRGMFDRVSMPMLVVRLDGRIHEANPALCYLFGYRPSDLREMDVRRLFLTEESTDVWSRALDPHATRSVDYRPSITCLLGDGRTLPARLTVILARNADGSPQHFLGLVDPLEPVEQGVAPLAPASLELLPVEVDILERLAAGYSHVQIASTLHFSRQGVDYHLDKLRRRLSAPSRTAIISRAYTLGLFVPGQWPPRIRPDNQVTRVP